MAQPTSTSGSLSTGIGQSISLPDSGYRYPGLSSNSFFNADKYSTGYQRIQNNNMKRVSDYDSRFKIDELRRSGSQAAEAVLGQYLDPGQGYLKGFQGPLRKWDPEALTLAERAMKQESDLQAKMQGQERAYDTAYAQAQRAQEMAKTKTGVIEVGSAAQKVIGGGTGAGQEKTGAFKGIYGAGSLLPASWMQNQLDPTKVAQKVSGLEDRNAIESLTINAPSLGSKTLYYGRSKFEAPTLQKTGLGRYATIV